MVIAGRGVGETRVAQHSVLDDLVEAGCSLEDHLTNRFQNFMLLATNACAIRFRGEL